jgi:hypothetical protein
MKHTFVLRYELPADLIYIEPAIQSLGEAGLRGGAEVDSILSLRFEREDDILLDAVAGAMDAVLKALPEAKFLKVVE